MDIAHGDCLQKGCKEIATNTVCFLVFHLEYPSGLRVGITGGLESLFTEEQHVGRDKLAATVLM